MKNKQVSIVLSLLLLLSSLTVAVGALAYSAPPKVASPEWDFPRLDTIYLVEAYPREVAMEKARACDIDNFVGAIVADDVRELTEQYGWSATSSPGFHMCYLGINCRDVTPDTSGAYWDYHGRTPGFPLYPLNISQFRLALELIVGCQKDAWIAEIYEFINVRLDTNIPPANAYWYNPYITPYPEDWTWAEQVLESAGFQGDAGVDNWIMPNGQRLRDRWAGDAYGIYVMCPGDAIAPTSHEVCRRHTVKWNKFFTGIETDNFGDAMNPDDGGIFQDEPMDVIDPLILVPFYNRDHDIYFLCWGLGPEPDYLWDFFHPDADVEGGNNSPGMNVPGVNRLLDSLKYWRMKDYEILAMNYEDTPKDVAPATYAFEIVDMPEATPQKVVLEHCSAEGGVWDEELVEGEDYTIDVTPYVVEVRILKTFTLNPGEALELIFEPGTYQRIIYELEELRDICWLVQWKLYYLCPYLPIYSRNYFDLYKPGLVDWVESPGFGSAAYQTVMPWTFANLHWADTPVGGEMRYHVSGDVSTINPFKASWVYEVTILNRMYDALYVYNPYTHDIVPWVATHWEIEPWKLPDNSTGMILWIWLRNDVTWQDGDPVTAEDIKWNFDFINSTQAPEYTPIISPIYQGCEVVHDYLLKIYINGTGFFKAQEFLGSALVYPRQVWEPFWGDYMGASSYKPWTEAGPADLPTKLYGTGPWILEYWDEVSTAKINKNLNYWARLASSSSAAGVLGALRVVGREATDNTPKIYGTRGIEIQLLNIDPFEQKTVEYYVELVDKNGASWYIYGSPDSPNTANLDPIDPEILTPTIKDWDKIPVGPVTVKLYVRFSGETDFSVKNQITAYYIPGDVNCDEKVDMIDLWRVAKDFGVTGVDPGVLTTDVNCDGKVDMIDLWSVAKQFGKQ